MSAVPLRHHVIREYEPVAPVKPGSEAPKGPTGRISMEPAWMVAFWGLDQLVSWDRSTRKSTASVISGAFTRAEKPLIVDSDSLHVETRKSTYLSSLAASMRGEDYGQLIVPGDWVMGFMFNSVNDRDAVKKKLLSGQQAVNGFMDGLKFVGRVHGMRKRGSIDANTGTKTTAWSLSAMGFSELDTTYYYNLALASAAAASGDIVQFMAQVDPDFKSIYGDAIKKGADLRDNVGLLISSMFNLILGRGKSDSNVPAERALANPSLVPQPQLDKEAPASYLVPRGVAVALGHVPAEASKEDKVFGYADICDLLIGTQKYEPGTGFYPILDQQKSSGPRKFCADPLKGTFLPVTTAFVNTPIWSILKGYLNSQINEVFAVLKVDADGNISPTVIARQIPFSTEAAVEPTNWPLTRFMSLPRWVIAPNMVDADDIGRSDATRCNFIHVYGSAQAFADNKSETNIMARNPPVFDLLDIKRSGIRARMGTVLCALGDIRARDEQERWLHAIADWSFGSHLTWNGTVTTAGMQTPVAPGDNFEYDGIVYHGEAVVHDCRTEISADGPVKVFRTTLELSNGMPADQGAAIGVPVYPGFKNTDSGEGLDADFFSPLDPGRGGT
jgi:hypothetical protein